MSSSVEADININNDQHHHHQEDESPPFFADITLDLAEAHDMAETPEPTRKVASLVLGNENNNTGSGGVVVNRGMGASGTQFPTLPTVPDTTTMLSTNSQNVLISGGGLSSDGPTSSVNDSSNNDPMMNKPMAAITSDDPRIVAGGAGDSSATTTGFGGAVRRNVSRAYNGLLTTVSRRQRNTPKDLRWAIGFYVAVPLCLFLPLFMARQPDHDTTPERTTFFEWISGASSARLATLHALFWGFGAALLLCRLLYQTSPGGDGDDARHLASQIVLAFAPISVSVYVCLLVTMYVLTRRALIYAAIPAWYLARDLYLFRSWKMTATTPGGRQAFFQALTCMTLDILSRSLRREAFLQMVTILVVVQFFVIAWWRMAMMAAFKSQNWFWILLALFGGKWATGTVARLLSLIASGGINSWFEDQNDLILQQQEGVEEGGNVKSDDNNNGDQEEEMIEFTNLNSLNRNGGKSEYNDDNGDDDVIPEAYRTADASAYKSALRMNDTLDDNFNDDDDDDFLSDNQEGVALFSPKRFWNKTKKATQRAQQRREQQKQEQYDNSTVKDLLYRGLTVSFGSVAKCGLLGGLAQFIWSQLRKIDHARATFGRYRRRNGTSSSDNENNNDTIDNNGIGSGALPHQHQQQQEGGDQGEQSSQQRLVNKILLHTNKHAREFVRTHSDMAMSHVAAYHKSYQRAAQDVAILIDESGTFVLFLWTGGRGVAFVLVLVCKIKCDGIFLGGLNLYCFSQLAVSLCRYVSDLTSLSLGLDVCVSNIL